MSNVISFEVCPEIEPQLVPDDRDEVANTLNSDLLRLSLGAAQPVIRTHPAPQVQKPHEEATKNAPSFGTRESILIDDAYRTAVFNALIIASLTILAFCFGIMFERGGAL